MKKILCIGEALVDLICKDRDQSLQEGEHFLKKPGGAPTNVAAAIGALGGKVDLAAKVGSDPFGQHLISVLENFSVGTRWVLQEQQAFTTLAFVSLYANGERDFYFNRGADGLLGIDDISGIDLREYSIVHFGSATAFLPGKLRETYFHLLDQCIASNVFTSFDPNFRALLFPQDKTEFTRQSWYFLERCHFFKLSDEEALLLTSTNSLEEAANILLQRSPAAFAITIGKDGALLGLNGSISHVAGIPVTPVDTTGAGDAFVGAVLFQLNKMTEAEMKSASAVQWQKIIVNANKAGARTCEYVGAMEAFGKLNARIFD